MSLSQRGRPGNLLASYPEYDLTCRFDREPSQADDRARRRDDERELTVFAGDEVGDSLTEWISVEADVAVPIDEIR